MKQQTLSLEAILPQDRDYEDAGKYVDARFRPSFVDVGLLQNLACKLAIPYKGKEEFPTGYLSDIKVMIDRYVRHVEEVHFEDSTCTFVTKDKWSRFIYTFEMRAAWFRPA